MRRLHQLSFIIVAATLLLQVSAKAVDIPALISPDGSISVFVETNGGLNYAVQIDGTALVVPSPLGLVLSDGTRLGQQPEILEADLRLNDTSWNDSFGKFSTVRDHFRELRVRLREPRMLAADPFKFEVLVRAYDDGVALRYVLPAPTEATSFTVTGNLTEFLFTGDHRAWIGSGPDAECLYPEIHLSQMPGDRRVLPLVVEAPNALVAVAEADAHDWSSSMLVSTGQPGVFGAKASLVSQVNSQTPRASAWHALLIARDAGKLTTSTLLLNLATPSQIADTSWIKPGISAWDVWWTGRNPYWPQHDGLYARGNTQSHKDFIDFAAEMGWPYMLVDWFWYDQDSSDPQTAIKPLSHIDMPALMAHAASKGVKLILWVNSKNIPSIGANTLFATYKQWGAAGVKIDFFQNNGSQGTGKWMEELAAAAANHQLVVDFHGVHTPTGLSRTWPNVLTQEGVLGAEYVKLGTAFTPEQMVRLPFTRGLLGPADVTPGGFLNTRADQFVPNSVPSKVTGTRARHLAFAMQIDSPYLCLADAPENYRDEPGLNFFRKLPTTWDTTRVLSSGLMTHLVQARGKGDSWWIAGMNLQQPMELDLNLDFLSGGNYVLTTYSDTPQSNQQPTSLAEQTRVVTRGETIHIRMENTGGFAATLRPFTIPAQPGVISYHWDLHGTIPSDGLSHAGVVPAPHWNNSYPARTSPPTAADPATSIKDNSGSATPLDIHFSHSAQWQLNPQNTSPTRDLDGSYNKRLLKSYVDMSGGNPQTLTLSEIPYANYNIYVYLSADTAGREGYVTDGTVAFHFHTYGSGAISGDNAVFIPATETSDQPASAAATYARFANLSGSSKNITVHAAGNCGIAGFQIVETLPAVIGDYDTWKSSSGVTGTTTGDDDGDGFTNYEEYVFGLDPLVGSSVNPITVPLDKSAGTFSYTRRLQSKTGLTYSIWTSTDLIAWTEDTGATEGIAIANDDVENVTVSLSSPPTTPAYFVRVRTP